MCVIQRVGEEPYHVARHHGRVAESAGDVVISGTDLQLTGHHGSDAGGRPPVHHGGQELARHHEAGRGRPTCVVHPQDRLSTRQAAQVKRTARAYTEG